MLDFVIIADGGGTKTRARGIRGYDGASFEAMSGSCVPGADMGLALCSLEDITDHLLRDAAIDRESSRIGLSLACAGLDAPVSRAHFIRQLEVRFDAVEVLSDGVAALNACVGSGPGAVVAIGTGVVTAVRTSDGTEFLLDGWGWPSGDRGGGAWIGRNAVERFLEAVDYGDVSLDVLFGIMGRLLGSNRDAIVTWLAAAQRRDYAALAHTVVAGVQQGSKESHQILRQAALRVEGTGLLLARKHRIHKAYTTGGLARSLTPYLDPKRFGLFPDATFAGAMLGAAKWLREFAAENVQGTQ